MSTFVLVHGAWHGGWCWYKVVARLQRAGHTVFAPDLPSLGADKTPTAQVTLESWNERLCEVLDGLDEPAILVGHSRGGLNISLAAESRPDKVAKLVYLCAFLLQAGEQVFGAAVNDPESKLAGRLIVDEEAGSTTVHEAALQEMFYADCADEDIVLARSLLQPEALAPVNTPLQITTGNFGRVARAYIQCTQDRAISISAQRAMCERMPCEPVISMETSHSPFFSAPDELVAHLISIAD